MGIRVAYGNRSGIDDAIASGIIPMDSIIIGKYGDDEAELFFYDKTANMRHIVAQTRFESADEAIEYAIAHSEVGQTVTVLTDGVYTAYTVQPDFSLREMGMGKFRPETIEELVGGVEELKEKAHTHENKSLLDSITEERMQKWDSSVVGPENLPTATDESKGLVRSTDKENGVSVDEDGTMEVNSLSIDKLTQDAESVIVFHSGSATE